MKKKKKTKNNEQAFGTCYIDSSDDDIFVVEEYGEIYPETNQKMFRPEINYKRVFLWVSVSLLIMSLINFLLIYFVPFIKNMELHLAWKTVIIYLILIFITCLIFLKRLAIFTVRLYQRYARFEVRCRCLFIPNCSEYMILSIQKYGLIKGMIKGFKRYRRCRPPNGGEDYP